MKQKINLQTYFLLGGVLEKLVLYKTFTTYFDRNACKDVESIVIGKHTAPSFGNPNGIQLYKVTFIDGSSHEYADMWIETEIELILDPKFCN